MIEARTDRSPGDFVRALARKAARIARAHAADRRVQPDDPRRWRSAQLLWPLFAKD